jgi:beta-glucosidase
VKRFVFLVSLCVACGTRSTESALQEVSEVSFPAGFLWGGATAGQQIEKGLANTDWAAWAATDGKVKNGDKPDNGPDAFAHVTDDIAAMKTAGMNSYRFSIEIARIYPTRAAFDADMPDADGLAKYDGLLDALVKAKIAPMVTLHHFAWPIYLSDPGKSAEPQGWERSDIETVFESWCQRMAKRYGDRVDLWVTINEPTVEAATGYLAPVFPPGVSSVDRMVTVMKRQVASHARCFDAIHVADGKDADGDGKPALVGIAKHDRVYEPADPSVPEDVEAAAHSRYFWNQWFSDAIIRGNVDDDFDGKPEKQADPKLVGRADFFGLNYYGVSLVQASGLKLKYVGVTPRMLNQPTGRPKNDLGWDIYPAGFGVVLDDAAKYGLPIYITENGIADGKDANRSRYLAEHLFELGKAVARGAKVKGYMHWSLMDNFEWASGYCPRFGLFRVDYVDPNRKRTATAAVSLFAEIAAGGKLTKDRIALLPAYQSQPMTCASF